MKVESAENIFLLTYLYAEHKVILWV